MRSKTNNKGSIAKMKNSEELMKARRTISNGRWIVVVCVLIIIGSVTKLIYFGVPDSASGAATLVEASTFNAIVTLFPSIGSKELFSPDNIVLISTIFAFVYGIKLLKKGYEDLKKIK